MCSKINIALCATITVIVLFALTPPTILAAERPAEVGKDDLLDLSPATDIDRRLFVAYAIERAYQQVPRFIARNNLRAWIATTQQTTTSLLAYERSNAPDEQLDAILLECAAFVDQSKQYLSNVDAISNEGMTTPGADDLRNNIARSSGTANGIHNGLKTAGMSEGKAAGLSLLAGTLDFLSRQGKDSDRQEADRLQRLSRERNDLNAALETSFTHNAVATARLASRYGWHEAEIPFLDSANGVTGMRPVETLVTDQPRNPFILDAYVRTVQNDRTPAADADMWIRAMRLVPKEFETLRHPLIVNAADAMTATAMDDLDVYHSVFGRAPGKYGSEAVQCWRAVAALQAGNLTPAQSYGLAKALGCAGHFSEGLNEATKALDWANKTIDRDFLYHYVCLSCLANSDLDICLSNLKVAFLRNPNSVAWAKKDLDLARLRKERVAAFEKLVKVSFSCEIRYGQHAGNEGDVTVANNSAFSLTGVSIALSIHDSLGQSQTIFLKTPAIEPGGTYTFSSRVDIPEQFLTSSEIKNFSCDQGDR